MENKVIRRSLAFPFPEAAELPGLDREEVRRWYNGYNWLGESVYNPFDLLLLFRNRKFKPYWFETGTPTFLIQLLVERQFFTPNLSQVVAHEKLLSTFDVDNIPPEGEGVLVSESPPAGRAHRWYRPFTRPCSAAGRRTARC